MFIKVKDNPDVFINTDNLESVSFEAYRPIGSLTKSDRCELKFRSQRSIIVSAHAGRALLEFMETNSSILDDDDITSTPMQPPQAPLTSRIAQHLRDNAPNGMSIMDLVMMFETVGVNDSKLLADALDTLVAEHVIVFEDNPPLQKYYHASNAPNRLPASAPTEF